MADNVTLNSGSGGASALAKEVSHAGDTVQMQGVHLLGVSGSEGSYTIGELSHAEDAAHSTGDFGLMPLGVRNDTLTALAGTDGDYAPFQVNASGALYVDASGSTQPVSGTVTANLSATDNAVLDAIQTAVETIDNAISGSEMQVDVVAALPTGSNTIGDVTLSGAALTALQLIDNAIYVDDADWTDGVSSHMLIGGLYQSSEQTITDGDVGPLSITQNGRLRTDLGGAALTALQAVEGAVSGSEMQADIVAALPTGSNTIGDVTISGAALTALQLIDNIVQSEDSVHTTGDSGVMMFGVRQDTQADFGADGDYVPFSIDANGAVRVTGGGGGTEYTEDAVAAADPVGGALILVREDAPASVAADGDNVAQRGTAYGAAYVQIVDSSGNFINSFGGSGGTSHTDDAAFSIGSASSITPTGYLADETTPDSVDEGDVGVPRMTLSRKPYAVITDPTSENNAGVDGSGHLQVDIAADSVGIGGGTQYTEDDVVPSNPVGNAFLAQRDDALGGLTPIEGDWTHLFTDANGALWTHDDALDAVISGSEMQVDIVSSAAIPVTDNGGSLTVDGTVTANLSATDNAVLDAIQTAVETLDNAISGSEMQVDVVASLPAGTNNIGDVDIASALPTGSNTIGDVTLSGSALTALQLIDNTVVTEDAAAAANPDGNMMMSMRDDEVGSTAIASDDGDVQALRSNQFGELKVTQIPDSTSEFKYAVVDAATSGDNTIVAAAGAGTKIRVLSAFVVAAGDVDARFESGASGTALTGQMDLTTNSGFVLPFNPAGWFETADNALLNLELSGAVSVDGSITYVEI